MASRAERKSRAGAGRRQPRRPAYGAPAEKAAGLPRQTQTEDGDEMDSPVVFLCEKCKSPVGDSLSWAGSDNISQIHLNCVTENVLIGKETHLYLHGNGVHCLVVHLSCRGCRSLIGMVCKSTPKTLDYKKSIFSLEVEKIDSYVLGSANQVVAEEKPQQQLVTLEYRGAVEQQLSEMKALVASMVQRLEKIEAGLEEEELDEP